jgi:hypothetical protein
MLWRCPLNDYQVYFLAIQPILIIGTWGREVNKENKKIIMLWDKYL